MTILRVLESVVIGVPWFIGLIAIGDDLHKRYQHRRQAALAAEESSFVADVLPYVGVGVVILASGMLLAVYAVKALEIGARP